MINNVESIDEGNYKCKAQNLVGTKESSYARLTVQVKPFFKIEPKDENKLAGQSVRFQCLVGGDPQPKVLWKKDDGNIPLGRANIHHEDQSLEIRNVVLSDEGVYICEAQNSVGHISAKAQLYVNSAPKFIKKPQDQKVGLNGVASFHCVADGNPPPSIYWTKEGSSVLMFPNNSYGHIHITPHGTLEINGVQKDDAGYYVCSAFSVVDSSATRTFLQVKH
uniref:Ig-like domain-containing protein n=1 Tax=Megaselia scalaris TaxID=36166 RepID=T1GJH5_MEGSC